MFQASVLDRLTHSGNILLLTILIHSLLGISYFSHPLVVHAQSESDSNGNQDGTRQNVNQGAAAVPQKIGPEAINAVPAQMGSEPVPAFDLQLSATSILGEGQTGQITATLTATATQRVTVSLGYMDGLSTPSDYATRGSQIIIVPGQKSASIPLTVAQDSFFEGNEALMVTVDDAMGLSFNPRPIVIRLIDDEPNPQLVSLSPTQFVGITEGRQSGIPLQLNTPAERSTTLLVDVAGGSAGFGTDYIIGTDQITLTKGMTTTLLPIAALADDGWEVDESVSLRITLRTANAPQVNSHVQATIYDDFDQDLLNNCIDPDDDNDGILDRFETSIAPDNETRILLDTDADSIPDIIDADSDGDGILDLIEAGEWRDGDKDGTPDHSDIDRDDDGNVDSAFSQLLDLPCLPVDSYDQLVEQEQKILRTLGSDGGPNQHSVAEYSRLMPQDTDKDGIIDSQDQDDDADGLLTITELDDSSPESKSESHSGSDGDGVANYLEEDTGIVRGYIWHDLDNGGIQNTDEPPAVGVEVSIYFADTSAGPSEELRQRTLVATTLSDEQGLYQFENLPNTLYVVDFVAPEGMIFTRGNRTCKSCNDTHDSDPIRVGLTRTAQVLDVQIEANSDPIVLDAGLTVGVIHTDYLFQEEPGGNGEEWAQQRVGGAKLILQDATGNEVARAVSDPNGAFTFKELSPWISYSLMVVISEEEDVILNVNDPSLVANLKGQFQTASGLPVTHHYEEQWG